MTDIVVTPSVRAFPPEYFQSITEAGIPHLIIDDSQGKADRSGLEQMPNAILVDQKLKREYLGEYLSQSGLIPSGNPSCKNFGLHYAWTRGFKRVILLDDDCDTRTGNFLEDIPVGKKVTARTYHTPSGWLNTLKQLSRTDLYARGYPYEHRGEDVAYSMPVTITPSFNEGLWYQTPDINGVDKLQMTKQWPAFSEDNVPWSIPEDGLIAIPYPSYVALNSNQEQKLPLSIMNVQLDTALVPAFWQPPDFGVYDNFRIRRHDDIWSMMFLKTLMNIRGDIATVGKPMIRHTKAGDMYGEILSEHCTNLIQPWLERVLDYCAPIVYRNSERSYAGMAYTLADYMRIAIVKLEVPGAFASILDTYAKYAREWASLFLQ